jgi:hypothetical protein
VARLRQVVQAPILAVEGNDVWFPLLERNVAHHRGVTAVRAFLSDRETTLPARIETEPSTGRLVPAGDTSRYTSERWMPSCWSIRSSRQPAS